MARAMVLSAGLGTRLLPLTVDLPKPLVPVGDRPLLAHIADRLRRAGFDRAVVNTHHAASRFESVRDSLPIAVTFVHEPVIRGTAGGIAGARAELEAPLLVWNGDILADPPIPALLEAARDGGLAFGVAPRAFGEGTVGLDVHGRVVRLRGERFGVEVEGGDYVGIAALDDRALRGLPETGCLVADVALPALRRGGRISTARVSGPWTDLGSLAAYRRANADWLMAHGNEAGGWVHPSASVAPEVRLRDSIVGRGARIAGVGVVARAIVWPGARATAPLEDAVVTTTGRVVRTA